MKMITTAECLQCEFGSMSKDSKQKVYCSVKDKTYIYGQRIPCENKKKKIGEDNEYNE